MKRSFVTLALLAASVQSGWSQRSDPGAFLMMAAMRSFLGVGVVEVTPERASELKLKEERGVVVTRVEEDSPAAKAGLKLNDVVLEYNGERVQGAEQFVRLVRETPAGRTVRLVVSRDGQMQTISAAIAARKARFDPSDLRFSLPDMPNIRIPDIPRALVRSRLGVEADSLTPQLAEFFGVKQGVLIRSVLEGSAAEKAGLKAGDVITKVDETAVASPAEVTAAVRAASDKTSFPVTIVREKREMRVTVPIEGKREGQQAPAGRSVRLQELKL